MTATRLISPKVYIVPIVAGKMLGRYRRLLRPFAELPQEACALQPQLKKLIALHQEQFLKDPLFVLLFTLLFTLERIAGSQWQQQKNFCYWAQLFELVFAHQEVNYQELCDQLYHTSLYTVPGFVLPTLADWLTGKLNLCLTTKVVSASEMLAAQAQGFRYVTLPIAQAVKGEPLGNRDALEFLLHDLAHANAFFRHDYDPVGQRAFFAALQQDLPLLLPLARVSSPFATQLEYLMSDMNSHPMHLKKYLKAIVLDFFSKETGSGQVTSWLAQLKSLNSEGNFSL